MENVGHVDGIIFLYYFEVLRSSFLDDDSFVPSLFSRGRITKRDDHFETTSHSIKNEKGRQQER
jgi:hypothetical protein